MTPKEAFEIVTMDKEMYSVLPEKRIEAEIIVESALYRLERLDGKYKELKKVLKITKEKQLNLYMLIWYFNYSTYENYVEDFSRDTLEYYFDDLPTLGKELLTQKEFNLLKKYFK